MSAFRFQLHPQVVYSGLTNEVMGVESSQQSSQKYNVHGTAPFNSRTESRR